MDTFKHKHAWLGLGKGHHLAEKHLVLGIQISHKEDHFVANMEDYILEVC